ncbi:nucleotidyltransferase family protein [Roseovarius sp. C7]|uniref:nucleotidyltransferase family protein n=1 Tax=Roseovarius sp. C7 TaxID=3398643 RepID=UPI0039F46824
MLSILIPAAGASSRMAPRDKLLEEIDGVALLRRQVLRALATGHDLLVTLPSPGKGRAEALHGLDCPTLIIPDARYGMAASLRRGSAHLPPDHALLVLLPDMPDIEIRDLERLIAAHEAAPDQVIRAADTIGTPGHPVILPARLRPALATLTGDQGAKPILTGEEIHLVPLPGHRATTDLDTPADWARWRATRPDQP